MELEILKWIQSFANDFLDGAFIAITIVGETVFLTALLTVLYWCGDREKGACVAFTLLVGLCLNTGLKAWVQAPRPIGHPDIRTLRPETATGSSFPSGHTQGVSTTAFALAGRFPRRRWYLLAGVVTVLVALSRLYLGVHWPKDVLVGALLGFFTAWICGRLWDRISRKELLILGAGVLFLPAALLLQDRSLVQCTGMLWGLAAGYILAKRTQAMVPPQKPLYKGLGYLLGLLLLAGVQLGLKALLPQDLLWVGVRYFLLIFCATGVHPLLLKKLNW